MYDYRITGGSYLIHSVDGRSLMSKAHKYIDKIIKNGKVRYIYTKDQLGDAYRRTRGKALRSARGLMNNARRKGESLGLLKKKERYNPMDDPAYRKRMSAHERAARIGRPNTDEENYEMKRRNVRAELARANSSRPLRDPTHYGREYTTVKQARDVRDRGEKAVNDSVKATKDLVKQYVRSTPLYQIMKKSRNGKRSPYYI